MDDAITPLPGSPPDMTGSKSSKTSSYHSSCHSDDDSALADISHFEDIGLDDEIRQHVPTTKPAMTTAMSAVDVHRIPQRPPNRSSPSVQRDLMTGKARPSFANLRGPVRGISSDITGLALQPSTTMSRRGFRSPSSPSLVMAKRQRTPSPNEPTPNNPSQTSMRSRRGSWQSTRSRKSSFELEKECDDEDGDDLPDHVLLGNVPLSPRPKQERTKTMPPMVSVIEKKERIRSVGNGTPPIPTAHGSLRSPLSPTNPGMGQRGISMGQFPINHDGFRQPRAKSWNAVLSELNEEAKALTQALEDHADQDGDGSIRQNAASGGLEKRRVQSSIAELPPLRKMDIMIDPLPVSKEKEKVLSRTRPSWLPPKNPNEERRHLKEYQKMMAAAQEADRKRESERLARVIYKDETASSLSRIWEEHVLPNWDAVTCMKRTRELWWRGIAPRSRGAVWMRAIGNELELHSSSFYAALRRARGIEARLAKGGGTEEEKKRAEWFTTIRAEIPLAYPELRIFQAGGPLSEPLEDVLMAYAMYRADIGYVDGTVNIVALLLLNLPDASSTFILLANMLNRPVPVAFLTTDQPAMTRVYNATLAAVTSKLPTLYNHLNSMAYPTIALNTQPGVYLASMFRSLFTHVLDVDSATRLLDVWVFEGDTILLRAAVAVFTCVESRLYSCVTKEQVLAVLSQPDVHGGPDEKDDERWMRAVRDSGRGMQSPQPTRSPSYIGTPS